MKTVDPATGDGADPATLFAPAHLPERQPARCDVTNNTACKGGLKKDWGYACQYWKTCNAECPQVNTSHFMCTPYEPLYMYTVRATLCVHPTSTFSH
jgi:hypothetical protein